MSGESCGVAEVGVAFAGDEEGEAGASWRGRKLSFDEQRTFQSHPGNGGHKEACLSKLDASLYKAIPGNGLLLVNVGEAVKVGDAQIAEDGPDGVKSQVGDAKGGEPVKQVLGQLLGWGRGRSHGCRLLGSRDWSQLLTCRDGLL